MIQWLHHVSSVGIVDPHFNLKGTVSIFPINSMSHMADRYEDGFFPCHWI